MTANELADALVDMKGYYGYNEEAATMLRQQQAEIEALKAEIVSIEKNTDYWADKANWIKNNKPLAWMQTWENQDGELKKTVNIEQIGKNDIPLYTHPVKELTDDEIEEVINTLDADFGLDDFAKAILRKAQEK